MKLCSSILVGVVASVLVAVLFSSCHGRFLSFYAMRDRETIRGTFSADLAPDYRAVRPLLLYWCPPFTTVMPGGVAAAVDSALGSEYRVIGGRLRVLAPSAGNLPWVLPLASWLLLLHILGGVIGVEHARWRAQRGAIRRGGRDARIAAATVPAMWIAGIAYALAAPLAGGITWFITFDNWWPGVLDLHEAFPSVIDAPATAAICLAVALSAGWVAARIAVLARVPRDSALKSRRCANCGYDAGRDTRDPCPECGWIPGRRRWPRLLLTTLTCGRTRLATYFLLIGGTIASMYIWAFGWPALPVSSPMLHPKYTLAYVCLTRPYDPEVVWRNGEEPTLIRWPDGTLLFVERVEGGGAGAPLHVAYATAWLPRGRDELDPANWLFRAAREQFPSRNASGMKVRVEGDPKGEDWWRIYRSYRGPYVGDLTEALVYGATDIEKVEHDHPLAGIGQRLLDELDSVAGRSP